MRRGFQRLIAPFLWPPIAVAPDSRRRRGADIPRGSRDIARQARDAEERRLLSGDR
jgi:hypothetical protein